MNRVELEGFIGNDDGQEIRETLNGTPVVNFRMATNEYYYDQSGQRKQHTEWHKVSIFGRRVEALAPKLRKGVLVSLRGSLRTTTWKTEAGESRSSTEVRVGKQFEDFRILRPAKEVQQDIQKVEDLPADDVEFQA